MESNILITLDKNHPFKQMMEGAKKAFGESKPGQLVFCIHRPFILEDGEEYSCKSGLTLLSPGHKIVFIGLESDDEFEYYSDDFLSDIDTLSNKFNYQKSIKKSRKWADRLTVNIALSDNTDRINLNDYIGDGINTVQKDDERLIKYIISLLTGSINSIDEELLRPQNSLLDEIRNKIVLFDADQTRFLYTDFQIKKIVSVQGLSGTGKTELLLHKLAEIYSKSEIGDEKKVFFTCHNIALANEIRSRIRPFFDRMRVARQIPLNEELFIGHAWGSRKKPDSGLYSYLCDHYGQQFSPYVFGRDYKDIYSKLLDGIESIPKSKFSPCFDYILVDENQDFPEEFFNVCKKIVREKVYTAGDVFQNIFDTKQSAPKGFNISLNRCYRTDPRTLMFAHVMGLGLKEEQRFNWFDDKEWESFGYTVSHNRKKSTVDLRRIPMNRFDEDKELDASVIIEHGTNIANVCRIIAKIKDENPGIHPGDIAVILLDDDREIFDYMDLLSIAITKELNWNVRRGYEIKQTDPESLYLTNANNVKGLEFPFVICITSRLRNNLHYRNTLYTMLTRSFLVTYQLFKDEEKIDFIRSVYDEINEKRYISDIVVPSQEEIAEIAHPLVRQIGNEQSWDDFVSDIFDGMNIDPDKYDSLKSMISASRIDKLDRTAIENFVKRNIEFA